MRGPGSGDDGIPHLGGDRTGERAVQRFGHRAERLRLVAQDLAVEGHAVGACVHQASSDPSARLLQSLEGPVDPDQVDGRLGRLKTRSPTASGSRSTAARKAASTSRGEAAPEWAMALRISSTSWRTGRNE
jgi:hypothetical protein